MTAKQIVKLEIAWSIFERLGGLRKYAICEEFKLGIRISQRILYGDIVLVVTKDNEGTYSEASKWEFYTDSKLMRSHEEGKQQ